MATPEITPSASLPAVSLVIPTHNRAASLRMVLEALTQQTTPADQFEVVLVCDGCTDNSAAMAHALEVPYRLVILEQTPNQGPAAARNVGVQWASAPLILFIDDDVVPEPTLIAEHASLHQHDERLVVIGPLLAPPGFRLNPWTRWEEAMLVKQYRDMEAGKWEPTPRQFYTGNASVRRAHILAVGGFNARFKRAEDVELAYRLKDYGLRFAFHPAAKGWHHALRSLHSWMNIATAYGQTDVMMYQSGRLMTLQSMARDFHWRRPYLQRLSRFSVGHPHRVRLAVGGLLAAARLAGWTRLAQVAHAAYSAIFNLRYYQSVSQHLGGAAAFWALVEQYHPSAARAPADRPQSQPSAAPDRG
jgi:GT2 family glycosyltransferase